MLDLCLQPKRKHLPPTLIFDQSFYQNQLLLNCTVTVERPPASNSRVPILVHSSYLVLSMHKLLMIIVLKTSNLWATRFHPSSHEKRNDKTWHLWQIQKCHYSYIYTKTWVSFVWACELEGYPSFKSVLKAWLCKSNCKQYGVTLFFLRVTRKS